MTEGTPLMLPSGDSGLSPRLALGAAGGGEEISPADEFSVRHDVVRGPLGGHGQEPGEESPSAGEEESRAEDLRRDKKQLRDYPYMTIEEAIRDGAVIPPRLPLAWPDWQKWRSLYAPRQDSHFDNQQIETALWRDTMHALFGAEWHAEVSARARLVNSAPVGERRRLREERSRNSLPEPEEPEEPEEPDARPQQELVPAVVGARLPVRRVPGSGSPQSEGSHRDLSDEVLAEVLLEPYDPSTLTLVEYQQRSQRCASSLRLRNVSFDREEFETQQLRAIQKDRAERSSSGPEVYFLCALQETLDSEERYEDSQIVRGLLPDYLPDVNWQECSACASSGLDPSEQSSRAHRRRSASCFDSGSKPSSS